MQKNETESPLLSAFSQGILTLTFNRPEARNALSPEITSGLIVALEEAQRDADVRAVVITGSGRAFCAGGDVKAMATSQAQSMNLAERQRLLRQRADASRLLHEMPKPSIAVLPGAAAGAGLALALACDFRIAARSAKISTAFAKVGLSGDYGMSYFLPRIVGEAKARELQDLQTQQIKNQITTQQQLGELMRYGMTMPTEVSVSDQITETVQPVGPVQPAMQPQAAPTFNEQGYLQAL
ncbi:MAG: hypothetical protein EBX72_07185, partial [Betaproteobacteria bacterium]|nr:hypothetical protein [Betaproteobacteria bacterium]